MTVERDVECCANRCVSVAYGAQIIGADNLNWITGQKDDKIETLRRNDLCSVC